MRAGNWTRNCGITGWRQERSTSQRICDLLQAVRQALGVPVAEIARVLQVSKSVVFRLEASERRRRISLRSMARLAAAMGCHIVYAVVPRDGGTLEEMAERRKWSRMLGENRG
jgi:transcriptional regulator with XRE-family HTH domain